VDRVWHLDNSDFARFFLLGRRRERKGLCQLNKDDF
jgi:hypothetical protein